MYTQTYNDKELIVWVDMSTYCNAACPECHRTNPNGLGKVDWLPLVQWTIDDFVKMYPPKTMEHIKLFDFCGTFGDPVMNKDIHEIITYIADNSDCDILIHTNGSMRTEDWWWDIGIQLENRLEVVFCIEGTTQDQHSFYRQKTDLLTVINNLEALAATKARASVFTVVHKHNQNDLYNIAELCADVGAQTIFFAPSNRFYKNSDRTKFKFIKNDELHLLEKPEVDYDHPLFRRGIDLGRELDKIKQMQRELRVGE